MTSYRDLVQRAIAVHHANLEMGLAHAREQEPLVRQVAAVHDRLGVDYTVRMQRNFGVVFNAEIGTQQIVHEALSAVCDVGDDETDGLTVACRHDIGIQCRVIFGDVP